MMTSSPFRWIGRLNDRIPFLLTVPHSGENVPPEAAWLAGTAREVLLSDVDRFVDELYQPAAEKLAIPLLATEIHRYCVDLNRYPEDIDQSSVKGATALAGKYPHGIHWVISTLGDPLIREPIARSLHDRLIADYHDRFHAEIARKLDEIRARFPGRTIFHIDCHSMPSSGTDAHKDSGRKRPSICLSDFNGKSASPRFLEITRQALEGAGFEVVVNWPYQGGRITQRYGKPARGPGIGMETLQIEVNRALYMSEKTRERLPGFANVQEQLEKTLAEIIRALGDSST